MKKILIRLCDWFTGLFRPAAERRVTVSAADLRPAFTPPPAPGPAAPFTGHKPDVDAKGRPLKKGALRIKRRHDAILSGQKIGATRLAGSGKHHGAAPGAFGGAHARKAHRALYAW